MSRIRTVKPEFFRHEALQDLESANPGMYPMLVYQGLWTQCDGQGVFEDRPRHLKLDILPFLSFDMEATIHLLESAGLIVRYRVGDKAFAHIPTFSSHQRLSGKEAGEDGKRHPLPSDPCAEPREIIGKQLGSNVEIPVAQEKEKEREREKERIVMEGECEGKPLSERGEVVLPFSEPDAPPDNLPASIDRWWWETCLPDDFAANIARSFYELRLSTGKPAFKPEAIKEVPIRRLAARIRSIDPGGDEVDSLFASFSDYHLARKKPPYIDPARTLGDWLTNREGTWAKAKAARSRNNGEALNVQGTKSRLYRGLDIIDARFAAKENV